MKGKLKKFKFLIFLGIFLFVLSGAVYIFYTMAVIGTWDAGYRVNTGAGPQDITINVGGTCQRITNTSGKDYFIPTKTTAEWNAFNANLPSGVATSSCQANPSNLALSHVTRSKSFSVSWTAGANNGGVGGCKLQFYTGSIWTDITSATSTNCDADSVSASYTLNADGWKASWDGTQIRLLRKSDSVVVGTFSQTLACVAATGSGSPTPTVDEDCNGSWDNATSYGCVYGCTQAGMLIEFYHYQPRGQNCTGGIVWQYGGGQGCFASWTGPYGCSTWYTSDTDTSVTLLDGSCCSYGNTQTCYTYY